MIDKKTVNKFLSLNEEIEEMQAKLAQYESDVNQMQDEVFAAMNLAADQHLINDQGEPIDGAIYWYSGQAIVRLNGTVTMLPVKTMDFEKVFQGQED